MSNSIETNISLANSLKEVNEIERREYSIKQFQEESKNSGRCFILRKNQNPEILKKEKIPLSALINYGLGEISNLKDLNGLICDDYILQDDNYIEYLDNDKFTYVEDYFYGFTDQAFLKNARISNNLIIYPSDNYYKEIYLQDAEINKLTFIDYSRNVKIFISKDTKIKTLEINNPKYPIKFNDVDFPINEIIEEIILDGKHYESNKKIKEHSGKITTTSLIESGLYILKNLSSNIEVGDSVEITNSKGNQTNCPLD